MTVQDLAGHEQTDIAVQRYAISLRFGHEENKEYLTTPAARLIRNGQGQWSFDRQFIPPMMALSASSLLLEELRHLTHRLKAKRSRLMAMRRESNQRMADFAVANVSLIWTPPLCKPPSLWRPCRLHTYIRPLTAASFRCRAMMGYSRVGFQSLLRALRTWTLEGFADAGSTGLPLLGLLRGFSRDE